MENWTHLEIFFACFVTAALSSLVTYSYSTVNSPDQKFEWRKACTYPFYFGAAGIVTCMLGFDYFGGKAKWYQVVGIAGSIGLGVLKVDWLMERLVNVIEAVKTK